MAGNSIGKLFTVTSFGESHGPALGCVVDGCPPGLELAASDMRVDLDRRKPGTSRFTTQRREADEVRILSGVFEGVTTGTSIGLLIENTELEDALFRLDEGPRSADHDDVRAGPGDRVVLMIHHREVVDEPDGHLAG